MLAPLLILVVCAAPVAETSSVGSARSYDPMSASDAQHDVVSHELGRLRARVSIVEGTVGAFDDRLRKQDEEMHLLRDEIARLDDQNKKLEARVNVAAEEQSHSTLGIGASLLVPTASGPVRYGLETNIGPLWASYHVHLGPAFGLQATANVWRVKWRWIQLGALYESGARPSVSSRDRSFDIYVGSRFDVRIWEGLEASVGVSFYLPEPISYLTAGDGGRLGDDYSSAFGSPMVGGGVRWEF